MNIYAHPLPRNHPYLIPLIVGRDSKWNYLYFPTSIWSIFLDTAPRTGYSRAQLKMLDPLTCLSIACSVMQMISFSHEVTSIVKRIKKDGTADPQLREHADNLSKSSEGLEQYLQSCDLKHLPKNQADLREIASKCLETSKEIQSKMDKIDSSRGVVFRALKLKWRKGDFEKLEQDMRTYQDTMQTHILVHLW